MSTKPTTSRGDSKLAPINETILTRRKSAQLKRQLRNKDSSIKRISQYTQLLLSPTKANTSKSPQAKSKNVSKNQLSVKPTNAKNIKEKALLKKDVQQPLKLARDSKGKFTKKVHSPARNVDKLAEYYPNKLKRSIEGKKVVLKPKHEMKVVVGTRIGKRKLVLPQKGAGSGLRSPPPKLQKRNPIPKSPKPKPHRMELSIEDLVHLHNDDMLDDEDWMEILTCPSPVWWEDPPDPGFDDEPVSQLPVTTKTPDLQEPVRKRNKTIPKKIEHKSDANITEVLSESNIKVLEMKKSDDKFMRKRSKLENLLGIMRNKVNDCIESGRTSDKNIVKREPDVDIKKSKANIDIKHNSPVSYSKSNSPVPKKEKRTSESTEEDPFCNFRDDDLLNDLENIEIPIKSDDDDTCKDTNAESLLQNSSHVDKDESSVQQKYTAEKFPHFNNLQDKNDSNINSNTTVIHKSPIREENNEIAIINSQISKLTTTSIEKDVNSSPVSSKSMSDETYESCSVKSQDADTISDTNIKFIDDDDDVSSGKSCEINEKKDDTQAKINIDDDDKNAKIGNVDSANKDEEVKKSCTINNVVQTYSLQNHRKEKDCMTVYKIISNEKDNSKSDNKYNDKGNKNNSMISKINELIKSSKEYNSFKANLPNNAKKLNEIIKASTEYNSFKTNLPNNEARNINELIKSSFEYNSFKTNLQNSDASKTKLDSFFKKHKNLQSKQIKRSENVINNPVDTSDNDDLNIKNDDMSTLKTDKNESIEEAKNKSDGVIENSTQHNNKNLNSDDDHKCIIVPNSSASIKYCLKCSCIFDTSDCKYCVEKAKTSTENHSLCKNSMKLTNSEKSKDVESFLCDSFRNKNDD